MTRTSIFVSLLSLLLLSWSGPIVGEPADDVDCKQCVHQKDIAFGAVGTGRLRKEAVNTSRLQDGAVNWQKLAVELQDRIVQLEATVAALQDSLADNTVLNLDGYLDLDTTDPSRPTAVFAGVNVQVVNGTGRTLVGNGVANGLGNLIVGYDEEASFGPGNELCSDGQWNSQEDCEANGHIWALQHKSGSHNVVIGPGHRYSKAGGFLAGYANVVNRDYASVSGGEFNTASNRGASVSGGSGNIASGYQSSVVGGSANLASNDYSSVSGGWNGIASGFWAVVSGGEANTASSRYAVVSGGRENTASGSASTVGGGSINTANRSSSVVSGGVQNTAGGVGSVVVGGRSNRAAGHNSVVSGGKDRTSSDYYDWVAGELWQDE